MELKGKDVVDARGDTVGEIRDVQGQNAVVAVGGFLGIGEKEVMIPKDRLTPVGSGSARKFQTNMTKEQIRDLADVRRSPTPSERTSPPPPASPPPTYR